MKLLTYTGTYIPFRYIRNNTENYISVLIFDYTKCLKN